jgi:hypothetical protein
VALRSIGGTENANTQRACWTGDLRGPVQFRFVGRRLLPAAVVASICQSRPASLK